MHRQLFSSSLTRARVFTCSRSSISESTKILITMPDCMDLAAAATAAVTAAVLFTSISAVIWTPCQTSKSRLDYSYFRPILTWLNIDQTLQLQQLAICQNPWISTSVPRLFQSHELQATLSGPPGPLVLIRRSLYRRSFSLIPCRQAIITCT